MIAMRPWRLDDTQALLSICKHSPDLARQTGGGLESVADAEALIANYHSAAETETGRVRAITDGERLAGCVGVTNVETRHRTGWCWYWVAGPDRGRGLATRGLATAAERAFANGVFRLELGHRIDNPASGAVAAKAGFVAEGVERAKLEYDGQRYDCRTYARLATDPAPPIEPLPAS